MTAIEGLAKFLFMRTVAAYDADPHEVDLAWADEDIRKFWMDEAEAIYDYLNGYDDLMEPPC